MMTEQEIQEATDKINKMTQEQMASLYRFAPFGHPYFNDTLPLWEIFSKRFNELGGMTPSISKQIDWEK